MNLNINFIINQSNFHGTEATNYDDACFLLPQTFFSNIKLGFGKEEERIGSFESFGYETGRGRNCPQKKCATCDGSFGARERILVHDP